MQKRVRGILIKDDSLILIKRVTKLRTYYVFPGGGVEKGESLPIALIREIKEELGLNVSIKKQFAKKRFDKEGIKQEEFFYLCDIIDGKLGTGNGPEYQDNGKYEGTHECVQIKISDAGHINLFPTEIRDKVVKYYFDKKDAI